MEVLIFIILLIVLIMLIMLRSDVNDKLNTLQRQIQKLQQLQGQALAAPPTVAAKPVEVKQETKPVIEPVIESPAGKPVSIPVKEEKKEQEEWKEAISQSEIKTTITPPVNRPPERRKVAPLEVNEPGFFERNPDLEKFIGENLANKIGIGILVLGIGFFVKYAIDQNWINEIGRVCIGLLCGGILLGAAHFLRKTFAAFSSVLIGGGIAVLYLTIAIAFHEYHLFSQTAAFLIMVVITGFAVLFSLAYDRMELAILSLLGGFASPFMVSTGEGNYIILFTYILILDLGMLVLAYYKKWNWINLISYIGTIILFASWAGVQYDSEKAGMMAGGLFFATAFYVTFFLMNIINNLKNRTPFGGIAFAMLLSNTFLYYGAGMGLLNNPAGTSFQGLFTLCLAAFNFILAFTLYKSDRVDRNVVFLLIGLVLTFVSLAGPVQLEGNYITLFWAAESVLLLWLSQKSGIRMMKLGSMLISLLMVISLVMDWVNIYGQGDAVLSIMLNKGYITSVFVLVCMLICRWLSGQEKEESAEVAKSYRIAVTLASVVILYISQLLELKYQVALVVSDNTTLNLILGTYNMAFLAGVMLVGKRMSSQVVDTVVALLGIVGMLVYLTYYHKLSVATRNDFLTETADGTGFLFHYFLLILTLLVALRLLQMFLKELNLGKESLAYVGWPAVCFFVFMASAELDHLVVWLGYTDTDSISHLLTQNHKIGYPILWGVSSFLLIVLGMQRKSRNLRIISLTFFLITLIKLFTVDIRGISEGGKIAAFISLGLLLLIVSFMYQRLKNLLLADEANNQATDEKP